MGWPTPQEYNEAIQNPSSAFSDPELQAGAPVLTPLGLPRPITGAFASVYQLTCGQNSWAVRCFLRDFADHQERYAAISEHLTRVNLPYMAGFTFLPHGIQVNRRWVPVLKMEWLEGNSLHSYVENNLDRPHNLLALADQWVQMIRALRSADIGHGDLQHGNVIVVNGQLRLIDYDGMYVPKLAGRNSHEIGHRNYQHPGRTEHDFGPQIDHFSTWVIYTSLVALAVEPTLWAAHRGGDECLLFRQEDFAQPERSPIFSALLALPDARLQSLTQAFKSLLTLSPLHTPPVDAPFVLPLSATATSADWLKDHMPATPATPAPAPAPLEPEWIVGFIGAHLSASSARFQSSFQAMRLALGASIGLIAALWLSNLVATSLLTSLVLTALTALANLGYWLTSYRREPGVIARNTTESQMRQGLTRVRRVHADLEWAYTRQDHLQRVYASQQEQLERAAQQQTIKEERALTASKQRLHTGLAAQQARRQAVEQRSAASAQQLHNAFTPRITAIAQQLADLRQTEQAEERALLLRRQSQFVARSLAQQHIERAIIPGVGAAIKSLLHAQGVITAADLDRISIDRIPGIGAVRAAALYEWRRDLEAALQRAAPQQLAWMDAFVLRSRFFSRRRRLEQQQQQQRQTLTRRLESTQQQAAQHLTECDENERQLRTDHQQTVTTWRAKRQTTQQLQRTAQVALDKQAAFFKSQIDQEIECLKREQTRLQQEIDYLEMQLTRTSVFTLGNFVRQLLFLERG